MALTKLLSAPVTLSFQDLLLRDQRWRLVDKIMGLKAMPIKIDNNAITRHEMNKMGISLTNRDYFFEPTYEGGGYYIYKHVEIPSPLREALVDYVQRDDHAELSSTEPWSVIGNLDPDIADQSSRVLSIHDPAFKSLIGNIKSILTGAELYKQGDDVNPVPLFNPGGYKEPRIPFFHLDMGKEDEDNGKAFYIIANTEEPMHTTVVINEPVMLQEFSRIDIRELFHAHASDYIRSELESTFPSISHRFPDSNDQINELSINVEEILYYARSEVLERYVDEGLLTESHILTGAVVKVDRRPHRSPDVVEESDDVSRLVIGLFITKR